MEAVAADMAMAGRGPGPTPADAAAAVAVADDTAPAPTPGAAEEAAEGTQQHLDSPHHMDRTWT